MPFRGPGVGRNGAAGEGPGRLSPVGGEGLFFRDLIVARDNIATRCLQGGGLGFFGLAGGGLIA